MKNDITCKQAVAAILRREEIKLSPDKRFRLWRHLHVCELCRSFSRQNMLLNAFIQAHYKLPAYELTVMDKEKIISKVLDEKK